MKTDKKNRINHDIFNVVRKEKTSTTIKPSTNSSNKYSKKPLKKKIVNERKTQIETKNRTKHKKIKINMDDLNSKCEYNLDTESTIKYYQNFIPKKLHDELFKNLSKNVPWTHGIYKMFGKPIKTPRLLYAMRDEDFDIKSVYKVTDSIPWTADMLKLKELIEKKTGRKYSYAQLNYYRNGDDYIGYHTDSEVQEGDVIASISLGATRKFSFRSIDYKTDSSDIYEIDLEAGSLIIMDENSAKNKWKHMLPKMKNLKDVRINITFRPN